MTVEEYEVWLRSNPEEYSEEAIQSALADFEQNQANFGDGRKLGTTGNP